ncbi:growth-regulating factor 4 [Striga asiatica]|uniref:Growth-regulating factor n=1 Tax=Striga asiatica TaxID=4170 RepID=A0A5A7PLG0_STRAF|nr:growth-regulating factor 4 [Striga asiatica]
MELNLKPWIDESVTEEDQETKLLQNPSSSSSPALPLFFSEPNTTSHHLSVPYSSDHPNTPLSAPKFPWMGSFFSLAQWQELELQALIYRHMTAGASVPQELLHLVRKSLVNSPFYPHHQYYSHYQPPLRDLIRLFSSCSFFWRDQVVQAGYWGKGAMDPEPGRCRRTDGKKWRCSRDVVAGHKYCERHMHRGRNRSRKPVEAAAAGTGPYGGEARKGGCAAAAGEGSGAFTITAAASRSTDLLPLNQRYCDSIIETKGNFDPQPDDGHSTGRTLRHFFDDWPKPLHESASNYSATNLSISMPENSSSDFSLTLGTTGIGDEPSSQVNGGQRENDMNSNNNINNNKPHQVMSWGMANWENIPVAAMGGPLAEALRLSATASSSSPTSVLHRLPRGAVSEGSYVTS